MSNAKDELTLLDLGSEGDGGGVLSPDLLGGLERVSWSTSASRVDQLH